MSPFLVDAHRDAHQKKLHGIEQLRKRASKKCIRLLNLDQVQILLQYLGVGVQMRRDNVSWLQKLLNMFVTWCSKQQKCTKVTEKEKSFKSCSKKSAEKLCLCFFLHQSIMYCDCHASQQPFYFVNVCVSNCE